ncbi:NADH-quinone oxidoreductase subunit G [Ornithinimicrobium pekingense]|uniref:NADH-quinone oxidoreductase n=1 Tax=Ornithinimicrobium pekingense TaxID=384677 RepID=A0ABQ2FD25_9MICO|nr:NADH-quinone oxidoreductase subunit G [Ornithinimicrobium pekingense]GGK82563.1 NADH-quinone oxidoreductase subunit G [Ornithinimicrobium pekingense]
MTVNTSPAAGGNAVTEGGDAQIPDEPDVTKITLTIDDVEVTVPEGTLVIRAAETVGIQIPRFCDHPLLDPVGACRQCLVDVAMPDREGNVKPMPKPQASCTMVATQGMVVNTQHTSPVADKAQHGVMELLLINHPLDCPVCDKGGECPLQNQALSNGRPTSRFDDVKRTFAKPVNISSQVLLDRERCILCARCTRFSDQIAGDPFIALIERGALQQVGIYEEKPFESYFSGNTVQICPVGALTGAAYRFRSRPFDLVSTPSVCEHCASGCSMRTDHRRGSVLRRMALEDPQVNEEWNCDKGRWAFTYPTLPDRLRDPVVREADGGYAVVPWRRAYQEAARGLEAAKAAGGVGVLVGGRVTVEDAYAYSKLARVALGTNDVDHRARPHSAEEAEFLAAHVVGMREVSYESLERATSVLLVGLEPEEESPIVFLRLRKAMRRNKTQVYAVAPFATRGLTKMGGTLLASAPGTEAEVLQALGERVASGAAPSTDGPAVPVQGSDAGANEYHTAADTLGATSVILVGERLATVPGALSAAAALAEASGAALAWVPRRAGERGAVEVGALPNLLPGGRPVADEAARSELAHRWAGDAGLPAAPGRDTTAMLEAAARGELAALVVGGVQIDDLPDPVLAREALARAFVVSLELRETDVHEYADVILPVAPQQEKAGAYADWEGRLRPFEQALASDADPDHVVLDRLADAMGVRLGTATVAAVRREITDLGSSATRAASPQVTPAGPASPGPGQAVLATWHHLLDAGSMQDGEPFLAGTAARPVARVSAATAASLGVADGDLVGVSTDRGRIVLPAEVTAMHDGVVWVPTNSVGSAVRATLGVDAGAVVTITRGEA